TVADIGSRDRQRLTVGAEGQHFYRRREMRIRDHRFLSRRKIPKLYGERTIFRISWLGVVDDPGQYLSFAAEGDSSGLACQSEKLFACFCLPNFDLAFKAPSDPVKLPT